MTVKRAVSEKRPRQVDVAIVGGGPSGLYAAWRLSQLPSYRDQSIEIFEATDHLGGRVRTEHIPPLPFAIDIGAMRYKPAQLFVSALIENLFHLPIYDHTFPIAGYFLRGRHILPPDGTHTVKQRPSNNAADLENQTAYRLGPTHETMGPDAVLQHAVREIFKRVTCRRVTKTSKVYQRLRRRHRFDDTTTENTRKALTALSPDASFKSLSTAQWDIVRELGMEENDFPLWETSLWDLVLRELTGEQFAYARDAQGYQSTFGSWNAAEHLPALLTGPDPTPHKSIFGGMGLLTESLRDAFENRRKQRTIRTHHELQEVRLRRDQSVELIFLVGGTKSITVRAKRAILALPQGALNELPIRPVTTDQERSEQQLRLALSYIVRIPAIKAIAYFNDLWFYDGLNATLKDHLRSNKCVRMGKDGQFAGAKVLTDLAVRQLYFHGPGGENHVGSGSAINAAVVAYCDAAEVDYWSSFSGRESMLGNEPYINDQELQRSMQKLGTWKRYEQLAVTPAFARALMRCIGKQIFDGALEDGRSIPDPAAVIFQKWDRKPYYAAWHGWARGCQPWMLRQRLERPFRDANLFVAGEAYSAEQGWIEGGLRSVERTLRAHFSDGIDLDDPGGFAPEWKDLEQALRDSPFGNYRDYVTW